MTGAAMDSLESREWCERNRDALKCLDCPVVGGAVAAVAKQTPKGGRVNVAQGRLF